MGGTIAATDKGSMMNKARFLCILTAFGIGAAGSLLIALGVLSLFVEPLARYLFLPTFLMILLGGAVGARQYLRARGER
jgi:hypothetical protein